MDKKIHSVIMLTLLLIGMLTLAFNIQPAKASGTIYIRADGSIDPPTAPIERDGDLYTLTDNITSDTDGIVIQRNNMTLDGAGHTIQGAGRWTGIELSGRINVTIRNTEITAFRWGIGLASSSNNSLVGNNMTEIDLYGISLTEASDNNNICGNNVTKTDYHGIFLLDAASNTISGNYITEHRYFGIWLGRSSNNTLCGNTVAVSQPPHMYGADGICVVTASNNNNISGNNLTANRGDGIYLVGCSNNSISGNDITANGEAGVFLNSCLNNTVAGNNLANNSCGVRLSSFSSNNTVSGNTITNNSCGVYLYWDSNNNTVSGNTFINDGLSVYNSYQNSVENNTVNGRPLVYLEGASNYTVDDAGQVILVRSDNIRVEGLNLSRTTAGIELWETNNSTISRNTITNNTNYGVYLSSSSGNTVSGNTITNHNYGVSLSSSSGNTVSGNTITNHNYHGVSLSSSSNNTISRNTITNNTNYGVYLSSSSSNTVSGNTITNNNICGVDLYSGSNNNTFSGNTITNNDYGVCIFGSDYNRFWHNNFVDNARQVYIYYFPSINVWDDGYPSGGNYWSDYEDRYPDAEELDGSGIWDTPYVIDANNQDSYPLMEPYSPFPRNMDELKTEIEGLGSEGEIDNQGIVKSLIAKLNVAQKLVDDGKIDQAVNILNAFINEVQAQSGKHITPEAADILIQSAEHILSNL